MAVGKALIRVLDSCGKISIVADGVTLTGAGTTLAALGVSWPVLAVGAAGVLAYAGYSIWRDASSDKKISEIPDIAEMLREQLARMATSQREDARREFALADVLEHAMQDPDARKRVPSHIGTDPLAAMLRLIRSEGKEREKLLEQNTAVVVALNAFIAREFEGIRGAFGLVEADLQAIAHDLRSANTGIDITQWLIERQHRPPLYTPEPLSGNENRFIYTARRVEMQGRDDERAELWGFLRDPAPFLWSAWTGLAGTGKSRLALQFCEEAQDQGWDARFFNWKAAKKAAIRWDFWSPGEPTLIVFDYVYEHAESVQEALFTLARFRSTLIRPVRCLLLERPPPADAQDSWWHTVLDDAHPSDGGVIRRTCREQDDEGRPHTRLLRGLSEAATIEVLRELGSVLAAQGRPRPDDEELARQLEQIKTVDAGLRPLITAFAAEAMAEDALQPVWDAGALVNYIRKKEQARWKTTLKSLGVADDGTERWINLLLLGTLCGGLTADGHTSGFFNDERLRDWIPSRSEYGKGEKLAHLVAGAGSRVFPKLEPDMLGECFVLESMTEPKSGQGGFEARDEDLIEFAWQADPDGIGDFLFRAANSFPLHETLDRLLAVPTGDGGNDGRRVRALLFAAMARGDRTKGMYGFKEPNLHKCVHDLAVCLSDHVGVSLPLLRIRAAALFNAFNESGAGSGSAESFLAELRTLHTSHPDDAVVREQLSKALFNASNHSESGSNGAHLLLAELRTLHASHPDDAAVREHLAMALFNAFCRSESGSNGAHSLLAELRTLHASHPDDAALREHLAMALFNAFYDSESRSDGAGSLFTELRTLYASHPDDAAVREHLAMALFNTYAHSSAGSQEAEVNLTDLRSLYALDPDDAAVRMQLTKAVIVASWRAQEDEELGSLCLLLEEMLPFADMLMSSEDNTQLTRELLLQAIDLAAKADDQEALRRIQAVRRAIFGDD